MLLAKTNEFMKLVTLNVEVIYRKDSQAKETNKVVQWNQYAKRLLDYFFPLSLECRHSRFQTASASCAVVLFRNKS